MDILKRLRRSVQSYSNEHNGGRPLRIELRGAAAEAMADELLKVRYASGIAIKADKRTPDEKFLNGDVCYFKGVPVIVTLEPGEVLTLE